MLALVAIALLVTGIAATAALNSSLTGRVDDKLGTDGPKVVKALSGNYGRRGPQDDQLPSDYYARVNDPEGGILGNIVPEYREGVPNLPGMTWSQANARLGEPFTVSSQGGRSHWRCEVFLSNTLGVSVTMAYSLDDVENTLDRLRLIEIVAGLLVLFILGILGYLAVRSALRPLVGVERTALAIAGGDLSRRVPELDPRTEVGRLGRAFNSMVSQIEQAFRSQAASEAEARTSEERMRRFIGDASHELRTPLTSIRGFAELYRQGAVSEPADVGRVMGRIEAESTRMSGLVEDLLLLARLDQQRPLEHNLVDLARIAEDAVLDARAVAPQRSIELERVGPVPPFTVGDEGKVRQVLANLVRNALVHTPDDAAVTVRVGTVSSATATAAMLEVADTGPGIAAEDAQRIFERFYRTDSSRSRGTEADGSGNGLGLSIVAAIVAAHHGTVGVDTAPGQGATFRVLLPLNGPGPEFAIDTSDVRTPVSPCSDAH